MNYKYTAIIIEPRKHKALEFVLHNICKCLDNNWKIIFFHGIKNFDYINPFVQKLNLEYQDKILLVNLNVENFTFFEYQKILSTKSIVYENINTELFLVFHPDSMIFEKNKILINLFLDYDYVGAPWKVTNYKPTKCCNFVGNGGFSLRNKSKMLEIIEKIDWNSLHNDHLLKNYEDLYFSLNYDGIHVKKPEYSKASLFCVDEVFSQVTLACHKPWVTDHYEEFKKIYPEVEILKSLQAVEED
jgi:hypothetical protein